VTDPATPTFEAELFSRSASRLATLFYDSLSVLGQFEPVAVEDLPPNYRKLLAHNDHMTVALEAWHKSRVSVTALNEWRDESSYARTSLLSRQSDGAVIQFGMMRIWLADLPAAAQEEIAGKSAPLGRVLIEHNVLREVQLASLYRVTPGAELCRLFGLQEPRTTYGRTAFIYCDGYPAVELLEIVGPDES
jgi:chorismate-pyruvate lyase